MNTGIRLRKATAKDVRFLWQLRNDAVVRKNSLASAKIPFAAHRQWFAGQLQQKRSWLFVIQARRRRIGQIRLDAGDPGRYTVNIALHKNFRNRGLGGRAIRSMVQQLRRKGERARLIAYVKRGNPASVQCFQNMGFEKAGTATQKGLRVLKLRLDVAAKRKGSA